MNSIQNVGNVVVKNVPQPKVEEKQNNLYKINFRADGDQFVRRGGVQSRPAILQQQPQQDPLSRMISEQEKAKKKEKTKNNIIMGCWRRLLRVPWTARRSNKSILKEISPGVS